MTTVSATAALAAIGLSAPDAVRLLFHRIVADQAFPLVLRCKRLIHIRSLNRSTSLPLELE